MQKAGQPAKLDQGVAVYHTKNRLLFIALEIH